MKRQKACAKSRRVCLAITGYTERGHGAANLPAKDRKVEVVGGVAGDVLEVSLEGRGRRAHLERIITPSLDRTVPRCASSKVCGGCSWQQVVYSAQLREKERALGELFAPLLDRGAVVHPIIPCSSPWEYRNKMEFSFSQDKKKTHFLGLHGSDGKGRVIDIPGCVISGPWYGQILSAVRDWWQQNELAAYHFHSNTGTLRTLTLREGKRTKEKMVILTVSGHHEHFFTAKTS